MVMAALHASHSMKCVRFHEKWRKELQKSYLVWWETLVLVSSLSWLHLDNAHNAMLG